MANSSAVCTSFKVDMLQAKHNFGTTVTRAGTGSDTFKMALYLTTASLGAATTAYSSTGELAASGNYTAGGESVTNGTAPTSSGTTAYWTPSATVTWTALTSSGSFDGVLLYNSTTSGNPAVMTFNIGTQSISASDFSLTMPTNDATTGLLRIA